eukprot:scaffold35023_cov30-Tisochrysis_lutea.AAC.3
MQGVAEHGTPTSSSIRVAAHVQIVTRSASNASLLGTENVLTAGSTTHVCSWPKSWRSPWHAPRPSDYVAARAGRRRPSWTVHTLAIVGQGATPAIAVPTRPSPLSCRYREGQRPDRVASAPPSGAKPPAGPRRHALPPAARH